MVLGGGVNLVECFILISPKMNNIQAMYTVFFLQSGLIFKPGHCQTPEARAGSWAV